jgi:hypothetical protein
MKFLIFQCKATWHLLGSKICVHVKFRINGFVVLMLLYEVFKNEIQVVCTSF